MGACMKQRYSATLYWLARAVVWVFTHLCCRLKVSGLEHVPPTGPVLIIANHLSWFDPLLLGVVLPRRVWFFAKIEIFKWPLIGWLCRETGHIALRRGEGDRAALEKGLAYLREGKAVGVFPEGTVARQDQMIEAHAGVAMLALRTGATILPIAHVGTRRILRGRTWWFPRVYVQIGKPYVPIVPEGVARKVALQTVTQEIMGRIAGMLPPEKRGVYK